MSAARASCSAAASASASTAVDGCVPLISARPSFGPSVIGASPAPRERLGAAKHRTARGYRFERLAFADQHQREMRERRQVAAGADRSARRHARMHAALSSAISASSVSTLMPGEAFRQHVRAQRHRRAHGARRQRLADAGGVAAEQVELQRFERVGRDLDVGERSEAGVDAVDRLVAARAAHRRRRATPRTRARAASARARPVRRASAMSAAARLSAIRRGDHA